MAPTEPVPPDPGDWLRRRPPPPDDRPAVVAALLVECETWMRARCAGPAGRYGLEVDDVLHEALERLLRSSTTVDLTRKGLLTWLGQCIDWAAADLVRQRRRTGGDPIGPEELDAALDNTAVRTSSEPSIGTAVDAVFLAAIRLNAPQVRIVLNDCVGPDLSLQDFARLTGRSYAAVRKDRQRAYDRIEDSFGLTPDEKRVFVAFRATGSVERGAARTRMTPTQFRGHLDAAHRKVDQAFSERRVDPHVP